MIARRIAIMLAASLFLVLAGTGTGNAFWTTRGSVTGTVAAGTIGISQTGFESLAGTFGPSGLVSTRAITVRNTGTVTAPYTLAVGAQSANALARAVSVRMWQLPIGSACGNPPGGTPNLRWTTVPPTSGVLAPAAATVYCIRTAITAAQSRSLDSAAMVATLSLTSAIGAWTASATAIARQSVLDRTAPTAPGTPIATGTTDTQTTLTWTASTDLGGVTAYDIYRDGVLVATVPTNTFTDTLLTQETTYSYVVIARDAANNSSAPSGAASVTTEPVSSTGWYTITDVNSALCLDAAGASTADGTKLISWGCSGATNQSFQFVPTDSGFYRIIARHAPALSFDIDLRGGMGLADGAPAQLWSYAGGLNQQWQIVPQGGGQYQFVNRNSGLCLDVTGASMTPATQLQQLTCGGNNAAQDFTLTRVG